MSRWDREIGSDTITMLRLILPALSRGDIRLCPRCCHCLILINGSDLNPAESAAVLEGWWPKAPAISRVDNESEICSPCGVEEALMEAFGSRLRPLEHWGPDFLDEIEEAIQHQQGGSDE